jgi:hypothetical protein
VPRGGELVVSIRAEPRTFNSLTVADYTTEVLASLTQAKLIRINRVTDEIEPWLAESWTRSSDGLRYVVKLRPNVSFSDGTALTASDVVFSLAAAYAVPAVADTLEIDGKKLRAEATDPQTVVITFPDLFAPALRMLDACRCCRATSSKRPSRTARSKALNTATPPSGSSAPDRSCSANTCRASGSSSPATSTTGGTTPAARRCRMSIA